MKLKYYETKINRYKKKLVGEPKTYYNWLLLFSKHESRLVKLSIYSMCNNSLTLYNYLKKVKY